MSLQDLTPPPPRYNPPAFNVPRVVVLTVAVLAGISLLRLLLSPAVDLWLIYAFGFVPIRYTAEFVGRLPGGFGASIWSFVTYAGLHGDATHLIVNCLWLAAFGSPLARRFGWRRFLVISMLATLGGAVAHLLSRWGDVVPVVGASAAVSGHMGAAVRFVFSGTGIGTLGGGAEMAARLPALPLWEVMRNPRVLAFVGVWFALNILFGLGSVGLPGMEETRVAWEAHIGGFLVGLLAFTWLDPIPRSPFRVIVNDGM